MSVSASAWGSIGASRTPVRPPCTALRKNSILDVCTRIGKGDLKRIVMAALDKI